MTKVSFYQISHGESALSFACRLTDIVYRRGHRIHIHTGSHEIAQNLDELLWNFEPGRFIPHALYADCVPLGRDADPIQIGVDEEPELHQQVMINLTGGIPDFFSRFERVAEVVPVDENSRTSARANYLFYKERGYALDYHEIPARPNGR